jgi:uncharacterized protein YpbB
MPEFIQAVPWLSKGEISRLLKELKKAGKITVTGSRRWAKWRIKDF